MTERPIILQDWEVRAFLAGRKTQVRRPMKPQPPRCFDPLRIPPGYLRHPFGTKLWVKETWWLSPSPAFTEGLGKAVVYRADPIPKTWGGYPMISYRWRPSVHMPRWASRLTLEVTNVRVERVQEISTADAIAEGMLNDGGGEYAIDGMTAAQVRFMDRWDTINQLRGYGWDKNPWVWVPDFKVVTP